MIVVKEHSNIKKLYSLDFGTYFIMAGDNCPTNIFMSMCVRIDSNSANYKYEYKVLSLEGCEGVEQWMREDVDVIPIDITKMYVKES